MFEEVEEVYKELVPTEYDHTDINIREQTRLLAGQMARVLWSARYFFWGLQTAIENELALDKTLRKFDCQHKSCRGTELCPRNVKKIFKKVIHAVPAHGINIHQVLNQWTPLQCADLLEAIAEWCSYNIHLTWTPRSELSYFMERIPLVLKQLLAYHLHAVRQNGLMGYYKILQISEIINARDIREFRIAFPLDTYTCSHCGAQGHHWMVFCPLNETLKKREPTVEDLQGDPWDYFVRAVAKPLTQYLPVWKKLSDTIANRIMYFAHTPTKRMTAPERSAMTTEKVKLLNNLWKTSIKIDDENLEADLGNHVAKRFKRFNLAVEQLLPHVNRFNWPVGVELQTLLYYIRELIIQLLVKTILTMPLEDGETWLQPVQQLLIKWASLTTTEQVPQTILLSVLPQYYELFGMYGVIAQKRLYRNFAPKETASISQSIEEPEVSSAEEVTSMTIIVGTQKQRTCAVVNSHLQQMIEQVQTIERQIKELKTLFVEHLASPTEE